MTTASLPDLTTETMERSRFASREFLARYARDLPLPEDLRERMAFSFEMGYLRGTTDTMEHGHDSFVTTHAKLTAEVVALHDQLVTELTQTKLIQERAAEGIREVSEMRANLSADQLLVTAQLKRLEAACARTDVLIPAENTPTKGEDDDNSD